MNKCTCLITYKEHLALNKVLFRTKTLPIIIIYDLVVLSFSVLFFVFDLLILGFFFLGTIIAYTLFVILLNKSNVKKAFNNSEALKSNVRFNYEFEEEKVNVEIITSYNVQKQIIRYDGLFKVIENKEYLFLFVNQFNSLVINKNDIDEQGLNDLRLKLKDSVKKYKRL